MLPQRRPSVRCESRSGNRQRHTRTSGPPSSRSSGETARAHARPGPIPSSSPDAAGFWPKRTPRHERLRSTQGLDRKAGGFRALRHSDCRNRRLGRDGTSRPQCAQCPLSWRGHRDSTLRLSDTRASCGDRLRPRWGLQDRRQPRRVVDCENPTRFPTTYTTVAYAASHRVSQRTRTGAAGP